LIAIAEAAVAFLAGRIVLGLMLLLGQAGTVACCGLLGLLLLALLSMLPPACSSCCLLGLADHDALLSTLMERTVQLSLGSSTQRLGARWQGALTGPRASYMKTNSLCAAFRAAGLQPGPRHYQMTANESVGIS
jgi:hypothetical protein